MNKAFSLIEVMVYVALSALLTIGLCKMYSEIQRQSVITSIISTRALRLTLPFDILRRDLISAQHDPLLWDESAMVCKKQFINKDGNLQSSCIGWILVRKNVYRLEGDYDFIRHIWIKKSRSLLFKNVTHAYWKLTQEEGVVTGVSVAFDYVINTQVKSQETFVSVR